MNEPEVNDGGAAFPRPASPLPAQDYSEAGMTLRDYACIHLGVPETGRRWLDEIIREARRNRFAGKLLARLSLRGVRLDLDYPPSHIASVARELVDAMEEEMERFSGK